MIYCKSKNFIFIKTQKTGGSSAEIVLSGLCNTLDSFTPITNYHTDDDGKHTRKLFTQLVPKTEINGFPIYNHMTALEVKAIDPLFFEKAFKFCFERHPFEKVISAANHKINEFNLKPYEYKDVIDHILDDPIISDKKTYTENNKIILNQILDYSYLNIFITNFYKKYTNKQIKLPELKKYAKKIDVSFLTHSQKIRIVDLFEFEFKYFNYSHNVNINMNYA